MKNPLEEIKKHQDAIEALKADAVNALKAERNALMGQLNEIDRQIEELTGRAVTSARTRTRTTKERTSYNVASLTEALKKLGAATPIRGKELNADVEEIKAIAAANPDKFKVKKNGPQPLIELVKGK